MYRILFSVVLSASMLGLPALAGCEKTVEEKRTVEQKRDGTVIEKSSKTTQQPDGTTVEKKSEEIKK